MMTGDLIGGLVRANLAGGAAILLVLLLRPWVRRAFGAQVAYRLWALPPLIAAAALLPFPAQPAWTLRIAAAGPAQWWQIGARADGTPWASGAAVVWALGAGVFAAILVARQLRFMASLGNLQSAVVGGRTVLRAAGPLSGPAVVGPSIVVPADFEVRFTPQEQAAILAHEGAHLARGDVWTNFAAAIVQCLCWFNPLVHLAILRLRLDQELACDAAVIEASPRARRAYGEALLKSQFATIVPPVGCLWPTRAPHPLKERIAMLKLSPPTRARRRLGAAVLAVLALGGGYAAWAAQPGAVIVNPEWVSRPTGADLVRFYPAAAVKARTPGDALMQCRVEVTGLLSGCSILRESPQGAGFGDAVMQLSSLFRMKPMTRDGRPVGGGVVRIPVAFRLAPEPPPPAG